jgi:MSHA pilin protein MshC
MRQTGIHHIIGRSRATNSQRGFTLLELTAVIVIVGVLALLAAPRIFDRSGLDSRNFYDGVYAALRYAQQTAVAQNRHVCAAFTANSLTLTTGTDANCTANPGGGINLTGGSASSCSKDTYAVCGSDAAFSPTPANFSFDAQGRPSFATTDTIAIRNAGTLCVAAETGYVYPLPAGQPSC